MEPEFERRYHPEIAAPAADRPEEIFVFVSACREEPAIGGDHVGGQQVVACQAVAPAQIPETAANVSPATPVVEMSPPGVARPKTCVA